MSKSKSRRNRQQQVAHSRAAKSPTLVGHTPVDAVPMSPAGSNAPSVVVFSAPAEYQVAFWTQCQSRVVGYLTTNGTIQIAICGMFATAVGILITQADATKNLAQFERVYQIVLPALCFIVLTLSANVYSWIATQITYIRQVGICPDKLTNCPTYDSYKELITQEWARLPKGKRLSISLLGAAQAFLTLPFNFRDIYSYYCLLYVACGIISLWYGFSKFQWWYILPFFISFTVGTHDIRRLRSVCSHLPTYFTKP